jgi:1-acyl-sn-glycerol-3-phosphate acyltransferase
MAEPVYLPVIGLIRTWFKALGLRFVITGEEHVPATGGGVVAMNHIGYLDFICVGYTYRPKKRLIRFMAKKEPFEKPVLGSLLRGMKHIAVDREAGAGSFNEAVAKLRSGELVGVFPEATISQSFELKAFKSGAVRMAQEAGVPVYPAIVWGSQRVWTKGRPKNLKRSGIELRVVLGEGWVPEGDPNEATEELKRRMQVMLDEARATYGASPASDDDRWWLPAALGGTAPTLEQAEEADAVERAARAARRKARDASN